MSSAESIPTKSAVVPEPVAAPSGAIANMFKNSNLSFFGKEDAELSDTEARYAAYASRIGQFVRTAQKTQAFNALLGIKRYFAYTSDVGEAFRPVVPTGLVRACYGISWAYVLGDVGNESYKAWAATNDSQEVLRHGSQQLVFNALASMIFPMYFIHAVVHNTQKLVQRSSSTLLRSVAPSAAGLLLLPTLPFLFDRPTEVAVEAVYNFVWPNYSYRPHEHKAVSHDVTEATNGHAVFVENAAVASAVEGQTIVAPVEHVPVVEAVTAPVDAPVVVAEAVAPAASVVEVAAPVAPVAAAVDAQSAQ